MHEWARCHWRARRCGYPYVADRRMDDEGGRTASSWMTSSVAPAVNMRSGKPRGASGDGRSAGRGADRASRRRARRRPPPRSTVASGMESTMRALDGERRRCRPPRPTVELDGERRTRRPGCGTLSTITPANVITSRARRAHRPASRRRGAPTGGGYTTRSVSTVPTITIDALLERYDAILFDAYGVLVQAAGRCPAPLSCSRA